MLRIGVISRLTLDILFSGLDHLPCPGEEIHAASLSIGLGGGPIVTPVLLHRMGFPVKLGTFLDDSFNARFAAKLLESHGFTQYENFFEGQWCPVTVSSVLSLAKDRSIVSYEEPCKFPDMQKLLHFFEDCDVALMPVLPALAEQLKKSGKRIVLDATDFDAAPPSSYLSLLDIITPNLKEAYAITSEEQPELALKALTNAGVQQPVIKLGEAGCMYLEEGEPKIIAPVGGLQCVDTTGAGDNFLAGLMYGYLRGWPFGECVRMANVFGALSTTAPGVFGANIEEKAAHAIYAKCLRSESEGCWICAG